MKNTMNELSDFPAGSLYQVDSLGRDSRICLIISHNDNKRTKLLIIYLSGKSLHVDIDSRASLHVDVDSRAQLDIIYNPFLFIAQNR